MAPKMSDTNELNTPAAPGLLRMALELRAPWELAAGLACFHHAPQAGVRTLLFRGPRRAAAPGAPLGWY